MQTDKYMELFYSRDIEKIKEVLTPIINECKLNNKIDILLGDFRFDFEDLSVMYASLDGCVECSKFGVLKKTDNIFDTQTFAITSEINESYEKDTPILRTISSIETISNEIYETHHIEVQNSNMLATEIITELDFLEIDNESKALLSKSVNELDKITYIESYLNKEYLKPVQYNEDTNEYELINISREDKICKDYILTYIEEEIISSLLYKIMIEILLNR